MAESKQKPAQFPPLQISDLLILTLCVSFSLALVSPELRDIISLPSEELRVARWRLWMPELTEYSAFGIALFGLIVLARQRARRSECPMSPGHWLFFAFGPFAVLRLFTGALYEVLSVQWQLKWPFSAESILNALFGATLLASSILTVRPLRKLEQRSWQIVLAFFLVWLIIGCAYCVAEIAPTRGKFRWDLTAAMATAYLFVQAASFVAVAVDLSKGVRRDWLHYSAMAMLVLITISNTIHYAGTTFSWWRSMLNRVLNSLVP